MGCTGGGQAISNNGYPVKLIPLPVIWCQHHAYMLNQLASHMKHGIDYGKEASIWHAYPKQVLEIYIIMQCAAIF
jgi:hypothetical protein